MPLVRVSIMKASWHILAVLLSVWLAGCASSSKQKELESMIVPAHKADFAAEAMGQQGVVFWTPSKADVTSAMARIPAFLATEAPSLGGRLDQYQRQFIGVIIDGQKRLYCNFRPLAAGSIHGGGAVPFQVEYDIESRNCLNLLLPGKK